MRFALLASGLSFLLASFAPDALALEVDEWDLIVSARQPIPASNGVLDQVLCSGPCTSPFFDTLSAADLQASNSSNFELGWGFAGALFDSQANLVLLSTTEGSSARTGTNVIIFTPEVDSRYEFVGVLDLNGTNKIVRLEVRLNQDPNAAFPTPIYRFLGQEVNVPNSLITLDGPGTIEGSRIGTLTAGVQYGLSWSAFVDSGPNSTTANADVTFTAMVDPLTPVAIPSMPRMGKALLALLLIATGGLALTTRTGAPRFPVVCHYSAHRHAALRS